MIRSPFIQHEGGWYVVVGWEKKIAPGSEVHLRPLADEETRLLESYRENFDAEAWAVIMGKERK